MAREFVTIEEKDTGIYSEFFHTGSPDFEYRGRPFGPEGLLLIAQYHFLVMCQAKFENQQVNKFMLSYPTYNKIPLQVYPLIDLRRNLADAIHHNIGGIRNHVESTMSNYRINEKVIAALVFQNP